jgi:hypothetical protein
VFSSPGTDEWPRPLDEQARLRQIVPDTFGYRDEDADTGPDFFVVLRASNKVQDGDRFRVAIVSWGPNTPTEPDPDTFGPLAPPDEYNKFAEFPWGSRAVGFITYFKDSPVNYSMDAAEALATPDNSGFNWVRSTVAAYHRTHLIYAKEPTYGPLSLRIDSASEKFLPSVVSPGGVTELPVTVAGCFGEADAGKSTTLGDGFNLIIRGANFGQDPLVRISGYSVTVNDVTADSLNISIKNIDGVTPKNPPVLMVKNTQTGEERHRDDLFVLFNGDMGPAPIITEIWPKKGGITDFPVRIRGANFAQAASLEVLFGETSMPVNSVSADGTEIMVGYPPGGLPQPGELDITVRNILKMNSSDATASRQVVELKGFEFNNSALRACFIATAAYGTPSEARLDSLRAFRDGVLLKSAAGVALVDVYYTVSPALADKVAQHPWIASAVRIVLEPLAFFCSHPLAAVGMVVAVLFALGLLGGRTRRISSQALPTKGA